MNLAKYDTKEKSEAGIEVELTDPVTGEDIGVFLTILGPDSSKAREIQKKVADRARLNAMRAKRNKNTEDDDGVDLVAELVIGWRGMQFDPKSETDDVPELAFSKENVLMVLRALPWIAAQVTDAFQDRSLFMKA